jgi:hypothetical protein
MVLMDGAPALQQPARNTLYRWAGFLLVVVLATALAGPIALIVLTMVAGGALIVTGRRASGWPRPVLIVAGALVMLAPVILAVLMYLEVTFGYTRVTFR